MKENIERTKDGSRNLPSGNNNLNNKILTNKYAKIQI